MEPPISTLSHLPILTLPPPPRSDLCPICLNPIANPAACQTGYVFEYSCLFKWIEGTHERQEVFMRGDDAFGGKWVLEEEDDNEEGEGTHGDGQKENGREKTGVNVGSRNGQWESGEGRCAITGRRVLGGTSGIRRIMV